MGSAGVKQEKKREGFTLVEIALALLVVAIGIVSIMGLFPAGLQSNQQAIEETRVAMFAEDVLNGVKSVIEETPWADVPDELRTGGVQLVGSGVFNSYGVDEHNANTGPEDVTVSTGSDATTIRFTSTLSPEEYVLRYFLELRELQSRYKITLQVWPNGHGPLSAGFVFETEVYHNGKF